MSARAEKAVNFLLVGIAYLDLRTRQALHARPMRRRLLAGGPEPMADSRPGSDDGFLDECSIVAYGIITGAWARGMERAARISQEEPVMPGRHTFGESRQRNRREVFNNGELESSRMGRIPSACGPANRSSATIYILQLNHDTMLSR